MSETPLGFLCFTKPDSLPKPLCIDDFVQGDLGGIDQSRLVRLRNHAVATRMIGKTEHVQNAGTAHQIVQRTELIRRPCLDSALSRRQCFSDLEI